MLLLKNTCATPCFTVWLVQSEKNPVPNSGHTARAFSFLLCLFHVFILSREEEITLGLQRLSKANAHIGLIKSEQHR